MERDFDPATPVGEVIAKLLAVILPVWRHASIPALVDDICASYYAAPYVSKVWGALSKGEKNVVARAVGFVACDAGLTSDHDPRFSGAPRSKAESTLDPEWEAAERTKRSEIQPTDSALSRTLAWVAALPVEVQPPTLILRYARIANLLASHWNDPAAIAADFDQLLIDRRGNRKGFPPIIVTELRKLARYYGGGQPSTQVSPTRSHSAWRP